MSIYNVNYLLRELLRDHKFRAAMKESGNATIMAKSVPMNAITIVCKSLVQTSRCCQDGL